jgi:hypothetical protein
LHVSLSLFVGRKKERNKEKERKKERDERITMKR